MDQNIKSKKCLPKIKIETSIDKEFDCNQEEQFHFTNNSANDDGGIEIGNIIKIENSFFFDQDDDDGELFDPLTSESDYQIPTDHLNIAPNNSDKNTTADNGGGHCIGNIIVKKEKEDENEDWDYFMFKPDLEIKIKEEKAEEELNGLISEEEPTSTAVSTSLEYRLNLNSEINCNSTKNEIKEINTENDQIELKRPVSFKRMKFLNNYFSTKERVKLHLRRRIGKKEIDEEAMFPCPFCGLLYYKQRIGNHITAKHPKVVHKVRCEFCLKYCLDLNSNDLNHHKLKHRNFLNNSLSCKFCKSILKNEKDLEDHIINTHENLISCDICQKRVPTIRALKDHHLFEHNGKNEKRSHFCEKCGSSFFDKKSLEEHAKEKNHS